jgi:hypothetical protein
MIASTVRPHTPQAHASGHYLLLLPHAQHCWIHWFVPAQAAPVKLERLQTAISGQNRYLIVIISTAARK